MDIFNEDTSIKLKKSTVERLVGLKRLTGEPTYDSCINFLIDEYIGVLEIMPDVKLSYNFLIAQIKDYKLSDKNEGKKDTAEDGQR